jgi:ketosteroid isomerase-like protein
LTTEDLEPRALALAAFAAANAGDLDGFIALIADDVEFTSMVAEAEGTVFRGHSGVLAWWKRVPEAFEDVKWEVLEVREAGEDEAVVKLRMSGRLAGVDLAQIMWMAAIKREGQVTWWAFHRTEAEAQESLTRRIAADRTEATRRA